MDVAVIGSRTIKTFDFDVLGIANADAVLTGGAAGVDAHAEAEAARRGIRCEVFRPDYKRWGRAAPHKRNDEILAACDRVVAMWDGVSRGTKSVIEKARKLGKPCQIIRLD